ncbi:MAG: helix-turn-helix domain-containing protein [Acidimicrobiales bacterium]
MSESTQDVSRHVTAAEMRRFRELAIATLAEAEEVVVRTRQQLKVMEGGMRRARRIMEAGHSAREVADMVDVGEIRSASSEVIQEIQAARHRAQLMQFRMAAAEGMSLAEIARHWGVSRQLVSRIVKEPVPRLRPRRNR